MTESEVDDFLHSQWCMVLGTLGPRGWPHLTTVGYGFYNGLLAISSFARAQKIVNIRRDPRVTCLVEINQGDYDNIVGVSIVGRAQVVTEPDAALLVARSVLGQRLKTVEGDLADEAAHRHQEAAEALAKKRMAVTIEVERVLSWDHRKLGGSY